MVAKTSAIGAVASHLIHGLNNPLAGIREHLRSNGEDLEQDDWADARKATSRMQAMINEVVDVLKNEDFDEMETLSGEGIAQYLRNKFELKAQEKELDFGVRSEARILLSARDANIAKLILSNLLDNAIEAVSEGGEVETRIASLNEEVVFTIIDTGPGFSEIAKSNLFSPIQSSKTAGAGIGLAISQQLARHLGATLELTRSSSSGSEIHLTLSSAQEVANQS
jgi:signal transduction histidine kinase